MTTDQNFVEIGRRTIQIERDAIAALLPRIGDEFSKACRLMLKYTLPS